MSDIDVLAYKKMTEVDEVTDCDSIFVNAGGTTKQIPKKNLIDMFPDVSRGQSAYEYAQAGGYEGTEEEFAHMLANIPTIKSIGYGTELPTTGSEGDVFILLKKSEE